MRWRRTGVDDLGPRVRPIAVVPERPVQTAAGVMASTPLVLIDLQTREGIVGAATCAATRRLRSPQRPS